MRKIFISSLFVIIILAGCSNDDAYNNAIQKGLDHIASEEYQKAEGAFELALDEKKDDEKATALLQQTVYYQDALKALDEGEFDSAKEKAEKVISIENGSPALIKKAEEIITSVEELKAEDKKAEDKKAEDKKAEDKKAEDKKAEEEKSEQDNATKEKNEKESEKQDKEKKETATEERPAKYNLELNPTQEGFYNDQYYSGDAGMAGPDETHTVEDARAMGYEVVPIDYGPDGPIIDSLDKPYPYDRWKSSYDFNHIEGRTYEYNGDTYEFVYTEIESSDPMGSHTAWFKDDTGFYMDFEF